MAFRYFHGQMEIVTTAREYGTISVNVILKLYIE